MTGLRLALAGLGMLVPLWAWAQGRPASGIDYQKVADAARWDWEDELAGPLWGINNAGDYDVMMISVAGDRPNLAFRVLRSGRVRYTWTGHQHSVFRIQGHRLYWARFHPSTSGGSIVAVDLETGQEVWVSPLRGIGGVRHSSYLNRMNLDANDDVVWVYGNESFGTYLEYKETTGGATVGHRVFQATPGPDRSGRSMPGLAPSTGGDQPAGTIWAGISVSSPVFDGAETDRLQLEFVLVNESGVMVEPRIVEARLIINGKDLSDWAFRSPEIVLRVPPGKGSVAGPAVRSRGTCVRQARSDGMVATGVGMPWRDGCRNGQ